MVRKAVNCPYHNPREWGNNGGEVEKYECVEKNLLTSFQNQSTKKYLTCVEASTGRVDSRLFTS